MPTVNMAQKGYTVTKWGQSTFNWDSYACPANWVDQLSEHIFQNLSKDTKSEVHRFGDGYISTKWVKDNINRHISLDNSNGKRVAEALIKIFAVMTKAVNDSCFNVNPEDAGQQTLVAEKIVEGLNICGHGFENRLNDLFRFWQDPRDFAERLELMRTEIVSRYGRLLSDETHDQNTVSKLAATGLFGTKAINLNDVYEGALRDKYGRILKKEDVSTELKETFAQEYTVLLAIKNIEEQIRSYFITHDYAGENDSDKGYSGVYLKWTDFLNSTFPFFNKGIREWLICEEKYVEAEDDSYDVVRDVNWPLVRTGILKKLTEEQLIHNPENITDMFALFPRGLAEVEYWLSCSPSEEDIAKWLSTLNDPHEAGQAACNILCFLPKDHPMLSTFMSKYGRYITKNNLDRLKQHCLKTPHLFKSRLFISRLKTILSSLEGTELYAFLSPTTTQGSILSELLQQDNAESFQSFIEGLKDHLTEGDIKQLLGAKNRDHKDLWQVAQNSAEKTLTLIELSQSVGITPPFSSLKSAFRLADLGDRDRFTKLSKKDKKEASSLLELAFVCRDDKARVDPLLFELTCEFGNIKLLLCTMFDQTAGNLPVFAEIITNPTAAASLLKTINELENVEQKAKILATASFGEWNALMLAARYQPDAVPGLLKAICTLDKAQQAELLMKMTTKGSNALMLAAQYQPGAVPALLEAISQLDKAQRAEILSKVQVDGFNALMLAARSQPDAVPELSEAISQLDKAQRAEILGKVQANGYNALMLAAGYQPDAVPELLKAICTLDKAQQADLLMKMTTQGSNALMLAAQYQPGAVPALLEAISQLDQAQRAEILGKVQVNGYNALMLAAGYQPDAVPELLKAISQLDLSQQAEILGKVQVNGYNALMLAARYQPSVVPELLKPISELDKAQRAEILGKVQVDGYNALMLAARYQPSVIPELLKAISQLDLSQQAEILGKTQRDGYNALMFAARYQPDAVLELLTAMSQLEKSQQADLLKMTDSTYDALMLAMQYQPAAVPALLAAISYLDKSDQEQILGEKTNTRKLLRIRSRLEEKLDSAKLLEALRLMKRNSRNGNGQDEIVSAFILKHLKEKFTPEDWYTIANENLISAERIKAKKEVILKHLTTLTGPNAGDTIQKALDSTTDIGKFFYTQRGFFACNEESGTLKKLKNLQQSRGFTKPVDNTLPDVDQEKPHR